MKRKMKMRIILVLSIVLILPILSACGSSSPSRLIVGEWYDGHGTTMIFERNGTVTERWHGDRMTASYDILNDNTLDIIDPNYGTLSYTWAGSLENVGGSTWFVTQEHLYFGRDVFTRR